MQHSKNRGRREPRYAKFHARTIRKDYDRHFEAGGVPSDEAPIIAELLVASNLTGHDSHGVLRIPQYMGLIESGLIQPGAAMEIERESASHALINGNWGFGHVIAKKAMSLAIEKAKSSTISAISVYNCNHIGRIGSYPMMAAEADMVGITMVNAGGTALYVAPFGDETDDWQPIR